MNDDIIVECKDGEYVVSREVYNKSVLVRDFLNLDAKILTSWVKEDVEAEIEELLGK